MDEYDSIEAVAKEIKIISPLSNSKLGSTFELTILVKFSII